MADESELVGLDPFDILDSEADRIYRYLSTVEPGRWAQPSRCEGWTVRDVLAHLLATEEYHRACLDHRVRAFIQEVTASGAADLASINAEGIASLRDLSPGELLERWRESDTETRSRFRQVGDGVIDTSVGDYPNRLQAFHVASELAIHADDIDVPTPPEEAGERREWRARFSRFSLGESKPGLEISRVRGNTRVHQGELSFEVSDDVLIEGVAGRLSDSAGLDATQIELLSTTP